MAWTICPACGVRYSSTRPGCPRCALDGPRPKGGAGNTLAWWFLGGLLVLILWRAVVALAEINQSGSDSDFWPVFFGGG